MDYFERKDLFIWFKGNFIILREYWESVKVFNGDP